jgi:hypothetical protein
VELVFRGNSKTYKCFCIQYVYGAMIPIEIYSDISKIWRSNRMDSFQLLIVLIMTAEVLRRLEFELKIRLARE